MNIFKEILNKAHKSEPLRVLKSTTRKVTKTDSNKNQVLLKTSNELTEWTIFEDKIEIRNEEGSTIVLETLFDNQLSHKPQLMIHRVYEESAKRYGISVVIIAFKLSISVNKYLEDKIEMYNITFDSWL